MSPLRRLCKESLAKAPPAKAVVRGFVWSPFAGGAFATGKGRVVYNGVVVVPIGVDSQ